MAKMVLTSATVTIDSNDLTDYANSAELVIEVDEQEVTTFGSSGWKEYLGGLKAGTLSIEFKQDYAVGNLDSIMWPLLGTVVTFAIRASGDAVSTSNPSYGGSILVQSWQPIGGNVGDAAAAKVQYPTTGAVTRSTS